MVGAGEACGAQTRILYPEASARHPTQHPFNSPRRNSMTNTSRVTKIGLLFLGVLVFSATSWAQTRAPILDQIAKTYGVDSWDQVQAIRYTWNGEITGLFKASRKWEWEPKTGKVSFEGKDKDGKPVNVTYMRSEINAQADDLKKQTDAGFTNDN